MSEIKVMISTKLTQHNKKWVDAIAKFTRVGAAGRRYRVDLKDEDEGTIIDRITFNAQDYELKAGDEIRAGKYLMQLQEDLIEEGGVPKNQTEIVYTPMLPQKQAPFKRPTLTKPKIGDNQRQVTINEIIHEDKPQASGILRKYDDIIAFYSS